MNPQIYGYFLEKALAAGALDVYTTPVQMKKNRPGTLLTVLCKPQDASALTSLIFAETTTFGVRTTTRPAPHPAARTRQRDHNFRRRPHQAVAHQRPHPARRPEFEDCRKLAVEKNVPLQQVITEALRRYQGGLVGARHAVPATCNTLASNSRC